MPSAESANRLPRSPERMGAGVLQPSDWLIAAAPVLYFVTLMSPWARLDYAPPSYDVEPDGSVSVDPPTAEEILHGIDTVRAIGTTSLLVCLALLIAVAAWSLAPALAYRPVRWPVARRAVSVVLAVWPAVETSLAVWRAATGSLLSPLGTAYVSAAIAVVVLGITVAQYRAAVRLKDVRKLAAILADEMAQRFRT